MARLPTLLTRRPVDPGRHRNVALVMASLVAGLLVLFSADRSMHQTSSRELGYQASQHGWPLIYLTRTWEENIPALSRVRVYDWPYPPVPGEIRKFEPWNLVVDGIFGLLVVVTTFLLVEQAVYRFDRWVKQARQAEW